MTSDKDIYISANEIIRQHGNKVAEHCVIMMARMEEVGNVDGGVVWGRILLVVIELQKTEARTAGNCGGLALLAVAVDWRR